MAHNKMLVLLELAVRVVAVLAVVKPLELQELITEVQAVVAVELMVQLFTIAEQAVKVL